MSIDFGSIVAVAAIFNSLNLASLVTSNSSSIKFPRGALGDSLQWIMY